MSNALKGGPRSIAWLSGGDLRVGNARYDDHGNLQLRSHGEHSRPKIPKIPKIPKMCLEPATQPINGSEPTKETNEETTSDRKAKGIIAFLLESEEAATNVALEWEHAVEDLTPQALASHADELSMHAQTVRSTLTSTAGLDPTLNAFPNACSNRDPESNSMHSRTASQETVWRRIAQGDYLPTKYSPRTHSHETEDDGKQNCMPDFRKVGETEQVDEVVEMRHVETIETGSVANGREDSVRGSKAALCPKMGSCRDQKCTFSHSIQEVRVVNPRFKTVPCRHVSGPRGCSRSRARSPSRR